MTIALSETKGGIVLWRFPGRKSVAKRDEISPRLVQRLLRLSQRLFGLLALHAHELFHRIGSLLFHLPLLEMLAQPVDETDRGSHSSEVFGVDFLINLHQPID